MELYLIKLYLNDIELGFVNVDDFFSKYGNCDGCNAVGLLAEAHVIKKLLEEGYEVSLVYSHNVEIREIKKGSLTYECVGDYGEVIKHMPEDLKAVFRYFVKNGVRIRIENSGRIPVYLEGRLISKISLKEILKYLISKPFLLSFIAPVFEEKYEPFMLYLGWEILLILFIANSLDFHYGKLSKVFNEGDKVKYVEVENVDEILNMVEEILERLGIFLVKEFWYGLEISNKATIEKEFKKLSEIMRLKYGSQG